MYARIVSKDEIVLHIHDKEIRLNEKEIKTLRRIFSNVLFDIGTFKRRELKSQ